MKNVNKNSRIVIGSLGTPLRCSFCGAEVDKPRPIGRYIVTLRNFELHGEKKKACQGCYHSLKTEIRKQTLKEEQKKKSWLEKLINIKKNGLYR